MNLIIILFICILAVFASGIVLCRTISKQDRLFRIPALTSLLVSILFAFVGYYVYRGGPRLILWNNIQCDALSLYHVFLVNIIFTFTAFYATGYFKHYIVKGTLTKKYCRRYCMLWQVFHLFLLITLLSNNIGIMWVALEATTLVSAFLILSDSEPLSIEAMWKYLLICSIGIVFAYMGTIFTIAAAKGVRSAESSLFFTDLTMHAALLNPKIMLLAFIFIVVGFGTKAGLSPMHNWLPDAHSQAPTPVSAVFSGVMLNCALYCIMRYMPIATGAMGSAADVRSILLVFGILSLIVAAIFIPTQTDIKRFLAYCSVEHMGIIAIGLGIGGVGTFAALLHTLNHSISKVLAFYSAGHISSAYGTRDMRRMRGVMNHMPLWGGVYFISILTLIGVAPFSIFMSKFILLKGAFATGNYIVVAIFLAGALAVFISALKHTMDVVFGGSELPPLEKRVASLTDRGIILICIAALLLLGVWVPIPFSDLLKDAASIVEHGVPL